MNLLIYHNNWIRCLQFMVSTTIASYHNNHQINYKTHNRCWVMKHVDVELLSSEPKQCTILKNYSWKICILEGKIIFIEQKLKVNLSTFSCSVEGRTSSRVLLDSWIAYPASLGVRTFTFSSLSYRKQVKTWHEIPEHHNLNSLGKRWFDIVNTTLQLIQRSA